MTETPILTEPDVENTAEYERRTASPRYRFEKHEEGTRLHVELPGVPRENIELSVEGDRLIVRGRVRPLAAEGYRRLPSEFHADVDYLAAFHLADDIDTESIAADALNGVLSLELPRKRPARREIPIRSNG